MRRLLFLLLLLAAFMPLASAETLFANFRYIWANNGVVPLGVNSSCNATTAVCGYWEAGDSDNPTVSQTLKFCWSNSFITNITATDALWSNGNCQTAVTLGANTSPFATVACPAGCKAAQYPIPAAGVSVGSIQPSDGSYHYLYIKVISPTSTPTLDHVADGSPIPYKYQLTATSNPGYGKFWPSTVPTTPVPLTASDFVAVGNVLDTYSVGVSSGATYSCVVTWGSQAGTIYNTGALGYWMQKHSVPCDSTHVALTSLTVAQQITASTSTALATLLTDIAATGRQAIAIGWAQPSIVLASLADNRVQGITGYLAYGGFVPGLPSSAGSSVLSPWNPYFNLATNTPFTTSGIRISMMLAAGHCTSACVSSDPNDPNPNSIWTETVSDWQAVVDAALLSYGTNPTNGTTMMQVTGSTDRTRGMATIPFVMSSLGTPGPINTSKIASSSQTGFSQSADGTGSRSMAACVNAILCVGASAQYNFTSTSQHPFLPGVGIGVNITSSGADIPTDTVGGQATALGWLAHGAVAAMGSATEPGQVPLVFPAFDVLLDNYTHGRTAIESLWGSVREPWTDNFIGDPLANPYASAVVPTTTHTTLRGVTLRHVTVSN